MYKNTKSSTSRLFYRSLLFCSAALALTLTGSAKAATRTANKAEFCSHLGKTFQASAGAQMYCFGPQQNGAVNAALPATARETSTSAGLPNVDAASRTEDRTNSGAYIGGQSETSIAASGNYVVEAWNDATGFFAGCISPNNKAELTGYGFSSDGGKTFRDLGGLPNNNCAQGSRWYGDPSVGTYSNSGSTYFYVSSLYACSSTSGCPHQTLIGGGLAVAVSACKVTGYTLSCGQPTIVATGNCNGVTNTSTTSCFPSLDKDYLTVDQQRKRLYISYTDFTSTSNTVSTTQIDNVDLAACDLDNPMAPVCSSGVSNGKPYVTLQRGLSFTYNSQTNVFTYGCEYEGAYPAVRERTGDVYVSYEYNWATNFLGGNPNCVDSEPTLVVVKHVPAYCLPEPGTGVSSCGGPFNHNANRIISMDATPPPGYNRTLFPNDFPRIAVSEPYKTVSLVWNDSRNTPLGDIFLQSYDLQSLDYIQGSPVRLNTDDSFEDMHFMPGLKNTSSDGLINVTWYDRRGENAGTGKTDVYGALDVNPRTSGTPGSNMRITNESTDWLATYSVSTPNFGDYTDNYVSSSNILYVAWSDGRSGVPQPYEAHVGVH